MKKKNIIIISTSIIILIAATIMAYDQIAKVDIKPICENKTYVLEEYAGTRTITEQIEVSRYDSRAKENRTITINETREINYFKNNTYQVPCTYQRSKRIEIKYGLVTRYLETETRRFTYGVEGSTITIKDLSRGGTWNDRSLTTCWNPGVPCKQITVQPIRDQTRTIYRDSDTIR